MYHSTSQDNICTAKKFFIVERTDQLPHSQMITMFHVWYPIYSFVHSSILQKNLEKKNEMLHSNPYQLGMEREFFTHGLGGVGAVPMTVINNMP